MKILDLQIKLRHETVSLVYDPYTNLLYEKEMESHFKYFREPSNIYQKISPVLGTKYPNDKNEVIPYIGSQLNRFVMDITEECNLRCKYCIYGGDYSNRRSFTKNKMTEDTLLKSINFIYNLKKHLPIKPVTSISFYGGEPFMNFKIIKKGINAAKKIFPKDKVAFLITSNGSISRRKEYVDFIIENDIAIHVSLDGPEEEHNKFRVYTNGGGSFQEVMGFIKSLKSHHVTFQPMLHPNHDWIKINHFFTKLLDKNPNYHLNINFFKFTNYKNNDQKKLMEITLKKRMEIENMIIEKLERGFKLSSFEKVFAKELTKNYDFKFKPYWGKEYFINSCYPGADKLMVNSSGDIFVCERVETFFKLGDIDTGFDLGKFITFWDQLKDMAINYKCKECPFHFLCSPCYAQVERNGEKLEYGCKKELSEKSFKDLIEFSAKIKLLNGDIGD